MCKAANLAEGVLTDAQLVHCGEEGAESEGEGLTLLDNLRSHPCLWSQALGNGQKSKNPLEGRRAHP